MRFQLKHILPIMTTERCHISVKFVSKAFLFERKLMNVLFVIKQNPERYHFFVFTDFGFILQNIKHIITKYINMI